MPDFISLQQLIVEYSNPWEEEQKFILQFKELLKHSRAFHRDHLPGHVTGSTWVVNPSRTKVLLHHHKKLNKWLQAGGHADGDENVLAVALRELEEETGVTKVKQLGKGIFDLDIHPIPARVDFPTHDHYDVRFCFEADDSAPIAISDESLDVKWIPMQEMLSLTQNPSMIRMLEKSKTL